MPRFVCAFAAVGFLLAGLAHADASVVVTVNKSTQRLSVVIDGVERHEWPVSTARWGYRTPNGVYRPERLERQWYSRKYDWSPMPYSIFFHGGYAIHGSYEISRLGQPASHGCIRLQPKNAALLFKIVSANRGDTRIVVTGDRPSYNTVVEQAPRKKSRQTTRARRTRERVTEQHYRPRVVERRARSRADFDEVFAPSPRYAYDDEPFHSWRKPPRNPAQHEMRRWWYDR
jgi:L,D-transpeptidase catalytic domain